MCRLDLHAALLAKEVLTLIVVAPFYEVTELQLLLRYIGGLVQAWAQT